MSILCIAKYSFIKFSELGRRKEDEKATKLLNGSRGDLNTSSLPDSECGILHVSYSCLKYLKTGTHVKHARLTFQTQNRNVRIC